MHRIWKYKLDHVAFWLVTILFYAHIRNHVIDTAGIDIYLADIFTRNLLIAGICYFNIYILFEHYFRKGRYVAFGMSVIGLLLVYTTTQTIIERGLNSISPAGEKQNGIFRNSYYHFSVGTFYLALTLALELSKRWYRQQLLLHRMQTEKLAAELQYLKAQLNPHFLFNCINTIYFQIDKGNDAARASLEKFSELLRYQLYECNEDSISIEKETSYLESYVDLQKLRKNGDYQIDFFMNENVRGFTIAPLLLLPFVENAFKHLSTDGESKNSVQLNMDRRNGSFYFCVSNSVNDEVEIAKESGIGLKNVRRRLDLLYEDRYKLDIQRGGGRFSVNLQIDVA